MAVVSTRYEPSFQLLAQPEGEKRLIADAADTDALRVIVLHDILLTAVGNKVVLVSHLQRKQHVVRRCVSQQKRAVLVLHTLQQTAVGSYRKAVSRHFIYVGFFH